MISSDFGLRIDYKLNGELFSISKSNDIVSIDSKISAGAIKIIIKSTKEIELVLSELVYDKTLSEDEFFFCNGYQSWTTSREYRKCERQYGLRSLSNLPYIKKIVGITGDTMFTKYGKQLYHSFSFTYFRKGLNVDFIGSINERTGYTIFYSDANANTFTIKKDIDGVLLKGEYELFNLVFFEGSYDDVFDKYFEVYPQKHTKKVDHYAGYTSWYNYFQSIDEKIILDDLKGMDRVIEHTNILQIDDGYETMIGDWELDANKFPNGMKRIVDEIHSRKIKAGIWVAPFSVQFGANLAKEHPEWLLTDKKGKKLLAGVAWNGFWALDIDQQPVREYIKSVFDKVFDDWGFDMVKLDFLYCIAQNPRNGKSRAQLMFEGMNFLRECCRDKIILGCGVPLAPSFGIVDACRIGSDAEFSFKDKFYTRITNSEIISTRSSINNAIFRRCLNGRIFANDPDVFFLRDDGMRLAKYNLEQKKLLAKINHMFGSVLFVSDNIGNYSQDMLDILIESYQKFDGKIVLAEYTSTDNVRIIFEKQGKKLELKFNIKTGEHNTVEC